MRAIREIVGGLALALLTTCTVLGGLFLAFSETGLALFSGTPVAQVSATAAPTTAGAATRPSHTSAPATTEPASPTQPAAPQPSTTPTPSATSTAVSSPTAVTSTHTPTQAASLTATSTPTQPRTATRTLAQAAVSPTSLPPTPCGPPFNWVRYTVQRGDTLFQLSQQFGVSMQALRLANCLADSNLLAGQVIFVPFVPATVTRTPTASPPPTQTSAPKPLIIGNILLVNSEADPSRPNGAIAHVYVDVQGGQPPYTLYDEEAPQASNPMRVKTDCGATILHTVRVLAGDGQSVSKTYSVGPVSCP